MATRISQWTGADWQKETLENFGSHIYKIAKHQKSIRMTLHNTESAHQPSLKIMFQK